MPQRVTFTRVQTVTIEFADPTDPENRPDTERWWTAWANNAFAGGSAIDMMIQGKVPAENMIEKNLGRWEATAAEPNFKPERPRGESG